MSPFTPVITVIIPTYNRNSLIRETIESVLNQTYTNYDLIIVDDASSDGTANWINKEYPDIQVIRLTQNRGSAGARNVGIKRATGDLIAFLDHDDRWLPNYLETQVKTLQDSPQAVLSFCNYSEISVDGKQSYYNLKPWRIYSNQIHHLLMENIIHTMSIVVIRRSALMQAGLLNENLNICNDRELYLRLLYLGEMVHIPENLVSKTLHSSNLSGNYRLWSKEAQMVLKIFFSDQKSKPYKFLEAEAKSHWSLKLAKIVWQQHHDVIFSLQMIGQALWFNPGLITKRIWRRLKKVTFGK